MMKGRRRKGQRDEEEEKENGEEGKDGSIRLGLSHGFLRASPEGRETGYIFTASRIEGNRGTGRPASGGYFN